jgi:hypothetical protein
VDKVPTLPVDEDKKLIPSMGNMEATSFFAQLRRETHGPMPRERSPSPVPAPPPDVVTINDGSNNSNDVPKGNRSKDSVDRNSSRKNHSRKEGPDHKKSRSSSIPSGPMAPNLPLPPGMERITSEPGANPISTEHFALYDNLLGANEVLKNSLKNQKVSITRDLPMPPGK